ncbi:cytochrome P450 [Thozetella sp. PMI_491]|nr:cytochrome P450 [Thozetella sp. PMI_491]
MEIIDLLKLLALLHLSTSLAVVFHKLLQRIENHRKAEAVGALPPKNLAPIKDPILGLDYTIATIKAAKNARYLAFMWERFRQIGNTHVTRRLLYDTIHTIDPENLKSMLSTNSANFCMAATRKAAMRPLFGDGIFLSDGSQWAHARALIRPSFSRSNMQPLLRMLERHFHIMVQRIPLDGSTFDLQELFSNFTMDTSTEFLMGHSTHTLDATTSVDRDASFVTDYLKCCLDAVKRVQMGPVQFLVPFNDRGIRGARDRAWAYVDSFVAEALELRRLGKLEPGLEDDAAEYNFLHEVARDTDDPVMLRTQILNILLASRDTTAGLLSNFFYVIVRDQRVFAKLKKEIQEHLHGELPTDPQLKNMVYLRWCINEVLRLYPSVPANTREAAEDTTLPVGGGPDGTKPIFVRKGTTVLWYVYAMHRRPDVYGEDAEEFRPERWDGLRPGWAFLPFNGGPRICIGQQFALTEAAYVIVRMLQTFTGFEARDDLSWSEFYTLALFSRHGVKVSVLPKESEMDNA